MAPEHFKTKHAISYGEFTGTYRLLKLEIPFTWPLIYLVIHFIELK